MPSRGRGQGLVGLGSSLAGLGRPLRREPSEHWKEVIAFDRQGSAPTHHCLEHQAMVLSPPNPAPHSQQTSDKCSKPGLFGKLSLPLSVWGKF